jgi:hypothetical protein
MGSSERKVTAHGIPLKLTSDRWPTWRTILLYIIRLFQSSTCFERTRAHHQEVNCTEWHKKWELLKNPTKIEEIQEKKFIDRNWIITTCLLRESNPNYQCLKITSCRWRPPPPMHSFTATTLFKSSRSFVSHCVCCMLCRMRFCRILQNMQHTQSDTKERELLKCVVAVKECIRGGGRHLQDVIFKHW